MWAFRMWCPSSRVCCRFNFPSCLQSQKAIRVWPLLEKKKEEERTEWKLLSFTLAYFSSCPLSASWHTWGHRGTCRPDPPLSTSTTPWRRRGLASYCRRCAAAGKRKVAPCGAQSPPSATFLQSELLRSPPQTAGGEDRQCHISNIFCFHHVTNMAKWAKCSHEHANITGMTSLARCSCCDANHGCILL